MIGVNNNAGLKFWCLNLSAHPSPPAPSQSVCCALWAWSDFDFCWLFSRLFASSVRFEPCTALRRVAFALVPHAKCSSADVSASARLPRESAKGKIIVHWFTLQSPKQNHSRNATGHLMSTSRKRFTTWTLKIGKVSVASTRSHTVCHRCTGRIENCPNEQSVPHLFFPRKFTHSMSQLA